LVLVNVRQPQQERSRATRQALLVAAITSLGELGWSGTTVAVVAERAGVSRGAAQHHFPTREALFTAAIDELMTAWIDDILRQRDELPTGAGRIRAVVERVVDVYTGPLFRAALELWVAAAADPQLRQQIAPFERRIGREAHRVVVELLDAEESEPGVREAIQATLDLARGLGLATLLSDDRRRREAIVAYWVTTLESALTQRSVS
jgi:AcrR family transcriptional regulator